MKKHMAYSALIAALILLPTAAFGWGWGVHAFVDDHFNTKWALRNGNQLYGGFSPDLFNYRFDAVAVRDYLQTQTHTNFMEVWDEARSVPGKAAAFGFVSHNELWGVDSTAHIMALTPGFTEGYVIAKARVLKGILQPILEGSGLFLPDPVLMQISHEFVEYGVDILLKNYVDTQIGAKMMAAAAPPNPNIPLVLEKAYVDELMGQFGMSRASAQQFIRTSEEQFRQAMAFYGYALMQENPITIELLSQRLAEIAEAFLAAYGISLPPGVEIAPLAQAGISLATMICAPDFGPEVFATREYVEQQLIAHGISY